MSADAGTLTGMPRYIHLPICAPLRMLVCLRSSIINIIINLNCKYEKHPDTLGAGGFLELYFQRRRPEDRCSSRDLAQCAIQQNTLQKLAPTRGTSVPHCGGEHIVTQRFAQVFASATAAIDMMPEQCAHDQRYVKSGARPLWRADLRGRSDPPGF